MGPKAPDEILSMDDVSLDTWMRENASDGIHISCSVPMGQVLDPYGRIPGLDGLRIGDASVMPTVVRANTHVTVIAIGEVMAELIIADNTTDAVRVRPLN